MLTRLCRMSRASLVVVSDAVVEHDATGDSTER